MGLVSWIVLGALAGWLASVAVGRNRRMGCMANIIVGVLGALLGGFIANPLGGSGVTGFNLHSLFVAFIGAVILLAVTGWRSPGRRCRGT
jgi:uncharacterized membrane protein YeaQ/YmgE (transglycosylase-associated protein family)